MRKITRKTNQNLKKGFTLVELLVTIACSTIVLITLSSSIIFINKMNKNVVQKTQNLYKVNTVKDYILSKYEKNVTFECVNGDVYFCLDEEKKQIVTNSLITNICVEEVSEINGKAIENGTTYYVCAITYRENTDKEYKFIVE